MVRGRVKVNRRAVFYLYSLYHDSEVSQDESNCNPFCSFVYFLNSGDVMESVIGHWSLYIQRSGPEWQILWSIAWSVSCSWSYQQARFTTSIWQECDCTMLFILHDNNAWFNYACIHVWLTMSVIVLIKCLSSSCVGRRIIIFYLIGILVFQIIPTLYSIGII